MSKKAHAQHNEKVCQLLWANVDCNDWVVTTAFYASLHYVQHEIFQFNDGNREYLNFDNYYNSAKFIGKRPSRHQATADLVDEHLPDCEDSYRFLYENCMTARYHRYIIPETISNKAIYYLNNIKGALLK